MMSSILDTLCLRTLQGEVSNRSPRRHRDLEFSFQVDIKPTGNDMVVPEICKVGRAPRTEPLGTRMRNGQRERNPPWRQSWSSHRERGARGNQGRETLREKEGPQVGEELESLTGRRDPSSLGGGMGAEGGEESQKGECGFSRTVLSRCSFVQGGS